MSRHNFDLTGQWSGEFAYPLHAGPITPFLATIEDQHGRLSGSIIEHDIFHGGVIEAVIAGTRQGAAVDFTKAYSATAPTEYAELIDYVGGVSDDGTVIKGVWSLLEWDGTFEMRRDAHSEEEISELESVSVPTP